MPDALQEAIREAYATCRSDVVYLDTLEVRNAGIESIFIVQDREAHDFTLETNVVRTFSPVAFRFVLPAAGDNGIQELGIAIDNTDRRISDFIAAVLGNDEPVTVVYRPYLSSDPTLPQLNPPLVLFMTDIQLTGVEINGRASFADLVNRKFLNEIYSRRKFPSL